MVKAVLRQQVGLSSESARSSSEPDCYAALTL